MDVTIVIILHNRHQNIRRLVEYYRDIEVSIILADSSSQKHPSDSIPTSWNYIYTPGINYTQKIELILQQVSSRYVILCPDDDFIIPRAIEDCISFLNNNPDYASVQGRCVCYKKSEVIAGAGINFYPIYPRLEYSYEAAGGLERLDNLLSDYKSYLYAVHRTALLKEAYTDASSSIRNLYLNEYNASILPVVIGKYKELPFLYQVREYAEDSDDKTAVNMNTLLKDPAFKPDIDDFVNHLSSKIIHWNNSQKSEMVKDRLITGFARLATAIESSYHLKPSLKKRMGRIVALIPVVGKKIIEKSRKKELETQMAEIVASENERSELKKIASILQKG
ncbi:TIGR00180 family glycosyltransferase [Niabella sp. CJ426]|uniref:TIGR00180 family glycosyltransferase n=1 Tax=Niabella sp. CJ426 TaxID=3393740 RepID=UPI003D049351